MHSHSERVVGKRRKESEEKENKKRLKEVWLLEINFLLLHSRSERVKGLGIRDEEKEVKKRVFKVWLIGFNFLSLQPEWK